MENKEKDLRCCLFFTDEEDFNTNVENNYGIHSTFIEFKCLPIAGELIQLTMYDANEFAEINNYDDFQFSKYRVIEVCKVIISEPEEVHYRILVKEIEIKLTRKTLIEKV
jgi:hypothetical protein